MYHKHKSHTNTFPRERVLLRAWSTRSAISLLNRDTSWHSLARAWFKINSATRSPFEKKKKKTFKKFSYIAVKWKWIRMATTFPELRTYLLYCWASSFEKLPACTHPFPSYLPQHHSCEDGLEVGEVVVAELGYNPGVQQHQLDRTWVWSDTDHHSVPQVSEGSLPPVLIQGTSTFSGTTKRLPTLDKNVARMEITVDKVIYKNLQYVDNWSQWRSRKIIHLIMQYDIIQSNGNLSSIVYIRSQFLPTNTEQTSKCIIILLTIFSKVSTPILAIFCFTSLGISELR